MKIDSLTVKNYKTLENINIIFDGYFASISGRNNAGKTTVIKSIRNLLKERGKEFFFGIDDEKLSYSEFKTQWVKGKPPIEFDYVIHISRKFDPGIYSFVEKIAEMEGLNESFKLRVLISHKPTEEQSITVFVGEKRLGDYPAKEIYQRINSSNLLLLHNSTDGSKNYLFYGGTSSFSEMMLSIDEKEELKKEQKRIQNRVKRFAQKHRGELSELLGRLEEKYEVELAVFERIFSSSVPVTINLKDKGIEVPLDDWGSGTQNRTQIMMSILSASRTKQQINDENRVTPIIIVEEPECFLHPSAQAEFGRVIRGLARELKIQIIITTHSPYMLCQENSQSNILLDRKIYRGHIRSTRLVPTSKDNWMEPFSEILGLRDDAIKPWQDVVSASRDKAVLVEGLLDKEYLEYIHSKGIKGFILPDGVEIIAYGGKDALKNSIMLKFVIEKFDRVFITFDLDAKHELEKIMNQLELDDEKDYLAIGIDEDGNDCIEGLIPKEFHSNVYAKYPQLVQKLSSTDSKKRKIAKNEIKGHLLSEFKNCENITPNELLGFKKLFFSIQKAFSS